MSSTHFAYKGKYTSAVALAAVAAGAGVPIDTRCFNSPITLVVEHDGTAGPVTICIETAAPSADDNCVPSEEWVPVTVTDICGDMEVSPLCLTFDPADVDYAADVINRCYLPFTCTDAFIRINVSAEFTGHVGFAGDLKAMRKSVASGCGFTDF